MVEIVFVVAKRLQGGLSWCTLSGVGIAPVELVGIVVVDEEKTDMDLVRRPWQIVPPVALQRPLWNRVPNIQMASCVFAVTSVSVLLLVPKGRGVCRIVLLRFQVRGRFRCSDGRPKMTDRQSLVRLTPHT